MISDLITHSLCSAGKSRYSCYLDWLQYEMHHGAAQLPERTVE